MMIIRLIVVLAVLQVAVPFSTFTSTRSTSSKWSARLGKPLHTPLADLAKMHQPRLRSFKAWGRSITASDSETEGTRNSPKVGSVVVGEVDEHDSSANDPKIHFFIGPNKGASRERASMSIKDLNWKERMALQVGTVMELYVTGSSASGELQVGLTNPSGSNSNSDSSASNSRNEFFSTSTHESGSGRESGRESGRNAKNPKTDRDRDRGRSQVPSGPLLNNLKTGMALEGTVSSCTRYAAFIDVGVVRAGKGGVFTPVNGMLHQNDVNEGLTILSSNNRNAAMRESRYDRNDRYDDTKLVKGSPVTVYVKEVYKQSGRFTLTMDSTIQKSAILEMKEAQRAEGNERRRARRARRILDDIVVGDTVTGIVERVVNEGVLVSISNLGSLNVTGLLSKRDLPPQFQVPPDLKDSFQKQLLQQDFHTGREIVCGVYKVNTRSNARMAYNLKLTFEEFGKSTLQAADEVDGLQLSDDMLNIGDDEVDDYDDDDEDEGGYDDSDSSNSNSNDNDLKGVDLNLDDLEFNEADIEQALDGSDVKDIYDELKGNKPYMLAADLFDWADVQDMIADKDLTLLQVEKAVKDSCGSGGAAPPTGTPMENITLKLSQFAEIVDSIQDMLDGGTGDEDDDDIKALAPYLEAGDDDDDDDDDGYRDSTKTNANDDENDEFDIGTDSIALSLSTSKKIKKSKAAVSMTTTQMTNSKEKDAKDAKDDEGAPTAFDEDAVGGIEDESLKEIALEIFNELKLNSGKNKDKKSQSTFLSRADVARMRQTWISSPDQEGDIL